MGLFTRCRRPQATGPEYLEQAAYFLRLAMAEPDHPAGYADLAEQLTVLAIKAGVTAEEAAAYLAGALARLPGQPGDGTEGTRP